MAKIRHGSILQFNYFTIFVILTLFAVRSLLVTLLSVFRDQLLMFLMLVLFDHVCQSADVSLVLAAFEELDVLESYVMS